MLMKLLLDSIAAEAKRNKIMAENKPRVYSMRTKCPQCGEMCSVPSTLPVWVCTGCSKLFCPGKNLLAMDTELPKTKVPLYNQPAPPISEKTTLEEYAEQEAIRELLRDTFAEREKEEGSRELGDDQLREAKKPTLNKYHVKMRHPAPSILRVKAEYWVLKDGLVMFIRDTRTIFAVNLGNVACVLDLGYDGEVSEL